MKQSDLRQKYIKIKQEMVHISDRDNHCRKG